MNVIAIIIRLLSLFALSGLALVLFLTHEEYLAQDEAFLKEQVANGYDILQSSKEAQWSNVKEKKQSFREVFDANDPVPNVNDPNPLTESETEVKASEDAILAQKDYREKLDSHTKEFGQGAFFWNSQKGVNGAWELSSPDKLESIANLKNNFSGIDSYKENETDDNGNLVPGVSHHNRLRTLLGKFYKDRKDKFSETSGLRLMITDRDRALRESQRLYDNMKEEKEKWEASSRDFELKFQSSQADLAKEKEERQNEKEAFETEITNLKGLTAQLEKEKQDLDKQRLAEIDDLKTEHGTKVSQLTREIALAEKRGYQSGVDYMMKQQTGANVAKDDNKTDNPFAPGGVSLNAAPSPPGPRSGPTGTVTVLEEVSKYGLATSIARIDKS
ncbi:MAG: hypothetical protein VB997_09775, partial [Opitutales bacterium]